MKPPSHFRLSPQSLALVTQYSQLIGCTQAEFLNRFLDDYLVDPFNDPRLQPLGPNQKICLKRFWKIESCIARKS